MNIPTFFLAAALAAPAVMAAAGAAPAAVTDHSHDFDFLVGKWHVHHWRRKDWLAGNGEWLEFDGTSQMWMTMNGHGTVDDNFIALPGRNYRAVGIRAYNSRTGTWSIWWLDERYPDAIEVPVVGNFTDGVGIFEGDDTFKGKPIRVRYTWSKITPQSAHWEQAFSPDGGKTWETNWRMDFTRVE